MSLTLKLLFGKGSQWKAVGVTKEAIVIQIQATTDYAIRILLYLYDKRGEGPVTSSEVAEAVKISPNYIHRIARQMRKAGLIQIVMGQNGGYRLRNSAEPFSLYDVIQIFEPEKLDRHLEEDLACHRNGYGCSHVRSFYAVMQEQWDKSLKQMTLEFLASNPDQAEIRRVLEQPPSL